MWNQYILMVSVEFIVGDTTAGLFPSNVTKVGIEDDSTAGAVIKVSSTTAKKKRMYRHNQCK